MEDKYPTVKAKINVAGRGHVFLNDEEIPVRNMAIFTGVGDVTSISLDVLGTIDGEFEGPVLINQRAEVVDAAQKVVAQVGTFLSSAALPESRGLTMAQDYIVALDQAIRKDAQSPDAQ